MASLMTLWQYIAISLGRVSNSCAMYLAYAENCTGKTEIKTERVWRPYDRELLTYAHCTLSVDPPKLRIRRLQCIVAGSQWTTMTRVGGFL